MVETDYCGIMTEKKTDKAAVFDIAKLRPLLFDMASLKYWRLGPAVGNCWNVGKSLKKSSTDKP